MYCFGTEQLVARILSNKYIWLLLKYKTNELGTHSDPRRKNISNTRIKQSVLTACENKQLRCLTKAEKELPRR